MAKKEREITTLNQKSINGIKPNGKRQLFYDGDYLYLSVSAKGARSFYFRGYRFNGKSVNEFSLGTYRVNDKDNAGDLTLSEAREKARGIIRTYRKGIDYHQQQKAEKIQAEFEQTETLDDWFNRWMETKVDTVDSTRKGYISCFTNWISPMIGRRSIVSLSNDSNEIEQVYNNAQNKRSSDMAKRCNIILNGIFTLAAKKKITTSNPTTIAKDEIKPISKTHYPAITDPQELGRLLMTIEDVQGMVSTKYAFKLIPYLMLRPANVVGLKWADVDFKRKIIFIDADRMKTDRDHCIPYPQQVGDILKELQEITGDGEYILPNGRGINHMNRDTLSKSLREMGYRDKHTPHGFRSTATTWLYDNHYYSYAIEKQMAHTEANKIVQAYSRDDTMRYIDDRRNMLQDFADYLDSQREQAKRNTTPKQGSAQ